MKRAILALLAVLVLVITFASGYTVGRGSQTAVCHSKTEDAIILDCDYHHGAWTPRHQH